MVAGVCICNVRILAACLPVKLTGIYNDAAKGRTMTADELCRGMYYDICTVLDGTDQIRSTKCVINYQRQTMLMRNLCDCINVRNVTVRIAQRLQIDRTGIFLNGSLYLCQIMCIYESGCHTIMG